MAVLVTGGAGYIGSHMAHHLVDAGQEVAILDNLSTGFRWAAPARARFVEGDVADQDLVAMIIKEAGIDAVIHFAGSIVVPDSISDPLGYYHNNTVKTRSLIETCIAGNVKNFIFSSTAAVYGEPEHNPVFETSPLKPISPYGSSKLMSEWMLRDAAAAHDFNYVALRYFNVAGADPKGRTGQSTPRATHLIKVASQLALGQRQKMDIFGTDYDTPDGTCIRDYIHVSDLISAHGDALSHLRGGAGSAVFNCGYGRGFSVLEVIAAVERACGHPVNAIKAARRPGDPPALVAGAGLIREQLGWTPRHEDLDFIVKTALDWENHLIKSQSAA